MLIITFIMSLLSTDIWISTTYLNNLLPPFHIGWIYYNHKTKDIAAQATNSEVCTVVNCWQSAKISANNPICAIK